MGRAEDVFPVANLLDNPPERTPTTLNQRVFTQLLTQFGIAEADALLPGPNDTADRPPSGFIAVNRQMCLSGAIPPFNDFLRQFLLRLSISPFQLHPNGHAILMGLCVLFSRVLGRLPSFEEICYFCSFSKINDHPSSVCSVSPSRVAISTSRRMASNCVLSCGSPYTTRARTSA